MSDFPEKSVTKMYGSPLLALRGGAWVGVEFPEKKHYVLLEWPLGEKSDKDGSMQGRRKVRPKGRWMDSVNVDLRENGPSG